MSTCPGCGAHAVRLGDPYVMDGIIRDGLVVNRFAVREFACPSCGHTWPQVLEVYEVVE